MRIPFSWLQDYIKISLSKEAIAEKLTLAGLEVEGFSDGAFEISLTPNLGHCMSVLGIARELAALLHTSVHLPEVQLKEEASFAIEKKVKVSIQNKEACPRYACRLIHEVAIGPSPEWLVNKLSEAGLRSINNVVDITNFVMLEMGQPLHAFDFDHIAGDHVRICNAEDGELFTTLDGIEKALSHHTLMIQDEKKSLAIAGILGGQSAEVSSRTVTVLLEAALFDASSIRRSSKELQLITEASKRFERGVDSGALLFALDRAAALVQEIAGGKVAKGTIDIKTKEFPVRILHCKAAAVNALLGTTLSAGEMEEILKRLGCHVSIEGQSLKVQVPTYRNDLKEEIDLVEEIARIYGYNNIPKSSARHVDSPLPHAPAFLYEKKVRSSLLALGLQEFLTCDLISPKEVFLLSEDYAPREGIIEVLNPSSVDQSYLRPSLLPGLLQVVSHNAHHQVHDLHGYEVGRVHFKYKDQYKEHSRAAILLCGFDAPHHWKEKPREQTFFDLKGVVEDFLEAMHIERATFVRSQMALFHPGRQTAIKIGEEIVGYLGQVHPSLLNQMDIAGPVLFAEIDLHDLYRAPRQDEKMSALPQFPASLRDLTLAMPENQPIDVIFASIESAKSPILESVGLLDIYESDRLTKGTRNVTLRFVYRDDKQTLSFEEVEKEHARIVQTIRSL